MFTSANNALLRLALPLAAAATFAAAGGASAQAVDDGQPTGWTQAPCIPTDSADPVVPAEPTAGVRLDTDHDGRVTDGDFGYFILAYFGFIPLSADFNGDGVVNPDDMSDYITAYFDLLDQAQP